MKQKIIYVICSLIIITIFFASKGNPKIFIIKDYTRNLDQIYIYNCYFGSLKDTEYKIDIKNKTFSTFILTNSGERNPALKNEGYQTIAPLSDGKIKKFLVQVNENGFTNWQGSYINNSISDGHQWGITLTFSDASEISANGSNSYPVTWDKMNDAFKDLTGIDVL